MTAQDDLTPEDQRQVDELHESVARWVSTLQLAGYQDSRIGGALVMQFRRMAIEALGLPGYVNLIAGMLKDELDEMHAEAEGGE